MSDKMTDQEALQLAALEYLGKGYRGYGYYADPQSCTKQIFDLAAKNAWAAQKTDGFMRRMVSGKTRTEYFNKFSSNINLTGGCSGFTATVTATFSTEVLQKNTVEYATLLDTVRYYRVTLGIANLTPEAQSAIDTMAAPDLFDRYGTHYTRSIYLGARVSYSSYLDHQETTSKTDVGATLNAEYLKLVKGGGGGSEENKAEREQVARNALLSVLGGNPGVAPSVQGDPAEFSKTYMEWSKSIWPDHVSIADFDDNAGLVPLYELATTSDRRAALQSAWTQYMQDHTPEYLRSPQPTPPSEQAVGYGAEFYLRYEDGTYLSALEQLDRGGVNIALQALGPIGGIVSLFRDQTEYYPTLRASGRVKFTFAGGNPKTPVKTGDFVKLVTGEREKNTGLFGKEYTHLGAWPGETCVYYYTPGYENQDWVVRKVTGGKDGYTPVNFGDRVFLTNRSYPGQRLCSAPGQFMAKNLTLLTTRETSAGVWTLEPA